MGDIANVMIAAMARTLKDGDTVLTGAHSALPMLACRLARRTHAPSLSILAGGSGAVNPDGHPVPASSCDGILLRADAILELGRIIDLQAAGRTDVFFAGGLQIDAKGRCNLVGVRSADGWKFRGPGSVGLPFLARVGRGVLYTYTHTPRVFVPTADVISGQAMRPDGVAVVTPLAVLTLRPEGAAVASVHPGHRAVDVTAATGFPLEVPDPVPVTEGPTETERGILAQLDPGGRVRGVVG